MVAILSSVAEAINADRLNNILYPERNKQLSLAPRIDNESEVWRSEGDKA